MATFEELLQDRKQYADDQTITINGDSYTLKDLRDRVLSKGDATRMTQRAREEASLSQQRVQDLENALLDSQNKLAVLSQQSAAAYQAPAQDEDPFNAALRQMREGQEAITKRLNEHEQGFWISEYNRQLDQLAKDDPKMHRQDVINFAKARGIVNLHDAHRLLYHDRITKEAAEKAATESREKALKEARAPRFAFPGVRPPKREASAPTWKDADHAEHDPEMWAAFEST